MGSLLLAELTSNTLSNTEVHIRLAKNNASSMETTRMLKVLESLKGEENRLKQSIDDIEIFHREMFALKKADTRTDAKKSNSMTDDGNETDSTATEPECSGYTPITEAECSGYTPITEAECSGYTPITEAECSGYFQITEAEFSEHTPITEAECSRNEPMNGIECSRNEPMNGIECPRKEPMNESKFPMKAQCFHISEPTSVDERVILRIPRSRLNGYYTPKMETDNNYVSGFTFSRNESADVVVESRNVTEIDESSDDTDEGCYTTDKSSDDTDEGCYTADKSSDDRSKSSCNEDEIVKMLLLKIGANKENGISVLVLHLIKIFSIFQKELRVAEAIVINNTPKAFSESHVNITRRLNYLSKFVLNLDKIVSDIFVAYSKMLDSLTATLK